MEEDRFKEYFSQGQQLGYSGESLQAYVDQCFGRHERFLERQAKQAEIDARQADSKRKAKQAQLDAEIQAKKIQADLEAKKTELEAELEAKRIEAELKKCEVDQNRHQSTSTPKSFAPKLPVFKEDKDDIDAFLHRFETQAENLKWDKNLWPMYLASVLEGQALSVYHSVTASGPVPYEELKKELLQKFQCTSEGFRDKLRNVRPDTGESFTSFVKRLENLFDRWIDLSGTEKTFQALRDLLVCEQILQSVSKDLAVFLRERDLKTPQEIIKHAESYRLAHPNKLLARKGDTTMFSGNVGYDATFGQQQVQGFGRGWNQSRVGAGQFRGNRFQRAGRGTFPNNQQQNWRGAFQSGNQMRGKNNRGGQVAPSKSQFEIECYNCGRKGHVARNCDKPKVQPALVAMSVTPSDDQEFKILCSCSAFQGQLPLCSGFVNDQEVRVLRDSGANTAGIRKSLVHEDQFTGETQSVLTFGGKVESFPVAIVPVDTPFFTGPLCCCVIDEPVADLIIGNMKGVEPTCSLIMGNTQGVSSVANKDWKPQQQTIHTAVPVVTRAQAERDKSHPQPLNAPIPDLGVDRDELVRLQASDASLKACFEMAKTSEKKKSGDESYCFSVQDGILYRHFSKKSETVDQIVVPLPLRKSVLLVAHDSLMAGHGAVRRTLARVRSHFYWPRLSSDVREYCMSCDICQKTVAKGRVPPVPLEFMPVVDEPFKRIAIDLVGPLSPPSDEKHQYILSIVDIATRYPEAIPLKKTDTVTIAEELFKVFSRMGFPQEILSDRGSQFTSELMKEILRLLSIKGVHTSPYHAQANGVVERFHGTLKSMLKKVIQKQPKQWHRYLPALLFAIREMPNESTGFSPFELLFGRQPRGPIELLANSWTGQKVTEEEKLLYQYVFDLKNTITEACQLAQQNVQNASKRNKHYHDKKSRKRTFQVGDEVLVLLPTDTNKLLLKWKGPFVVRERFNSDYKIDMNGKEKVFHANMLKLYVRRKAYASASLSVPTSVSVTEGEAEKQACCLDQSEIPFSAIVAPEFCPQAGEPPELADRSCNDVASVAVLPPVSDPEPLPVRTLPDSKVENVEDVVYDAELSSRARAEMKEVFSQFTPILTSKPGTFKGDLYHEIRLTSDTPVRKKQYPLPFSATQTIEKEVSSMLAMGVIEPSTSPYSSPVVLVGKKDGTTRFCIDFRWLNKITVFDAEPIPDPEDIFTRLSQAECFTKIDLSKGYWQIPVKPEDRPKTAFQTPSGLFQWTRMPFGLASAPATFARMMRMLDLERFHALNFFDDILVASTNWKQHLADVQGVMATLQSHGLTARPSKIFAGFKQLEFLGHIVGKGCLQPEKSKVQKILSIATPRTKKQVRSLLGLIGYYRRYVPNYSTLTAPITDLLKAGSPRQIVWSTECAEALLAVQRILSSFPVLLLPDPTASFVLQTDASGTGIGAVLLQEREGDMHPISYVSRKLLDRETRYSTIERECLAIVWAVSKFSRYLWGKSFVLQTDHRPLKYLNSGRHQNSRIMRWCLSLQEFSFEVEALPGKSNTIADMLSRSQVEQSVP